MSDRRAFAICHLVDGRDLNCSQSGGRDEASKDRTKNDFSTNASPFAGEGWVREKKDGSYVSFDPKHIGRLTRLRTHPWHPLTGRTKYVCRPAQKQTCCRSFPQTPAKTKGGCIESSQLPRFVRTQIIGQAPPCLTSWTVRLLGQSSGQPASNRSRWPPARQAQRRPG
jgi:hypothetical protein